MTHIHLDRFTQHSFTKGTDGFLFFSKFYFKAYLFTPNESYRILNWINKNINSDFMLHAGGYLKTRQPNKIIRIDLKWTRFDIDLNKFSYWPCYLIGFESLDDFMKLKLSFDLHEISLKDLTD